MPINAVQSFFALRGVDQTNEINGVQCLRLGHHSMVLYIYIVQYSAVLWDGGGVRIHGSVSPLIENCYRTNICGTDEI